MLEFPFVISVVLRLTGSVFFRTVLWYLLFVIFWKVPLSAIIMPDFLCALTRLFLLDYFWQILLVSFAESCLQAVHGAGSARGQREIEQPLEPKLWTDQWLLRETLFDPTLWWLLWIVSTTLSRLIIGGIYTLVPVLCTPGWSSYSMPTSRWFRMIIAGWCFSPLLEGILSLLIPKSLVNS
jgi:hypothetical protein